MKNSEQQLFRQYLSRREFMKAAGVVAGSALLAACVPDSSGEPVVPTPRAEVTPVPTSERDVALQASIESMTPERLAKVKQIIEDKGYFVGYNKNDERGAVNIEANQLTIIGGLDVVSSGVSVGELLFVAGPEEALYLASSVGKNPWDEAGILIDLPSVTNTDGHLVVSKGYIWDPVSRVYPLSRDTNTMGLPIWASEWDGNQLVGYWYQDAEENTFYAVDLPDGAKNASIAEVAGLKYLKGLEIIKQSDNPAVTGYKWVDTENGQELVIDVTESSKNVNYSWNEERKEWEKIVRSSELLTPVEGEQKKAFEEWVWNSIIIPVNVDSTAFQEWGITGSTLEEVTANFWSFVSEHNGVLPVVDGGSLLFIEPGSVNNENVSFTREIPLGTPMLVGIQPRYVPDTDADYASAAREAFAVNLSLNNATKGPDVYLASQLAFPVVTVTVDGQECQSLEMWLLHRSARTLTGQEIGDDPSFAESDDVPGYKNIDAFLRLASMMANRAAAEQLLQDVFASNYRNTEVYQVMQHRWSPPNSIGIQSALGRPNSQWPKTLQGDLSSVLDSVYASYITTPAAFVQQAQSMSTLEQ